MTNSFNLSSPHGRVVKYPLMTEKATRTVLQQNSVKPKQYTFIVDRYSDKPTIKSEIESLFNVKVVKINTCYLPRKKKRVGKYVGWKPQYKKAIIRLAENNKINFFENP